MFDRICNYYQLLHGTLGQPVSSVKPTYQNDMCCCHITLTSCYKLHAQCDIVLPLLSSIQFRYCVELVCGLSLNFVNDPLLTLHPKHDCIIII